MGVMDKFLNYMKIGDNDEVDDDGYYDDDEDFVDDDLSAEPEKPASEPVKISEKRFNKSNSKQQPAVRKKVTMNDSSVCIFKPKSFDEAREIVETLLEERTIVLNFEGVDLAVSQRVLDVITGACMAINGNLQKISNFIFIATPASVDVSGDLQDNLTGVFDSF